MDTLSREEFTELANFGGKHCISIYMPTHESGVEVNEKLDVIRFKNNLQQARVRLFDAGADQTTVDKILSPGFDLLKNEDFWHNLSEGLGFFMASGYIKIIKLPVKVKEELIVNTTFYLTPILPILADRQLFYLLVLSKNDAALYEGDQYEMHKVNVESLPNGIDDVIHFEEKGGQQLFRKGGTSPGGEASYHGHGAGIADTEDYVGRYLKEVDQTLWTEILGRQKAPLVLAGVDYIVAKYKQISRYKYIWKEALLGNYDYTDQNTLCEKAKEKLTPYFRENVNKALKNYYDNSSTELTSSIPEDVIPAAYYAQVSDLFVEKNQHIWGTFNEKDNHLIIHDEPWDEDECLINKAMIKTLMNGGSVHLLEKEKMPADSKVAAFLRFSL